MKCPKCGKWNQAAFPRCYRCGTELPKADPDAFLPSTSWHEDMHKAEPSETYIDFGNDPHARILPSQEAKQDILGREIEGLKQRRERGAFQLASLRQQARQMKESTTKAAAVKPAGEPADPYETLLAARTIDDLDEDARVPERKPRQGDQSATPRRIRRSRVGRVPPTLVLQPIEMPSVSAAASDWRGHTAAAWKTQGEFFFTEDTNAPVLYDGYLPSPADKRLGSRGMDLDPLSIEQEKDEWSASRRGAISTTFAKGKHQTGVAQSTPRHKPRTRRRHQNVMLVQWVAILSFAAVAVAAVILGMPRLLSMFSPETSQAESKARVEQSLFENQFRAHTIWVPGIDGTTIWIEELGDSKAVIGGTAEFQIPDYLWYENEEDIPKATLEDRESMPVTLTPSVVYGSGAREALPLIHYDIEVPLSQVTLIRPASERAEVSTSIFDIRIQVERGSHVVIAGDDVTDQVDANGRVSKSVPVPVGTNWVHIEVRTPRRMLNKIELELWRAPQSVPLEMAPDTLSETEGISDEDLIEDSQERQAALQAIWDQDKRPVKKPQMKLFARSIPGADIRILSPHLEGSLDLSSLDTDGTFSFVATFPKIGDNEVQIQARHDGREAVLTHVVYYVPPEDIYSRRAWAFERSDYVDLVNNIERRKGQVYVCKGIIKEIISERPQLAIMDTGLNETEQLVLIENNSKTTWVEGRYYRVFGDAFDLYNVMPWLIVRYTYPY
ncbi:MAG: hypothetical protein FWD25_04055 [Clostridia bacterium]|nr:hypothetical protein [Clostridia bacterium]